MSKIAAIIPTYKRIDALRKSLQRIKSCSPAPDEIIVHVDANDNETAEWLALNHPDVVRLSSDTPMGPGGGRNKLIRKSSCKFIASFDDDSWPTHDNFFAEAVSILNSHKQVSLVGCKIIEGDLLESQSPEPDGIIQASSFVGCGCVFRRDDVIAAGSYVPMQFAYGMEELDVGLRMLETGMTLAYSSRLEVFHDCNRAAKHSLTKNNACQITNTALLPFLRYPLRYWPYALLQVANRVKFCLVTGRYAGIISGLLRIPYKCWQYRSHRSPVSKETIHRFLKLRRGGPIPIEPGADASVHDNSHPELQTTRS